MPLLAPVGIRRVLPTKCSNRNPRWAILNGSPTLSSLAIGHRLRRQGLDNAGDQVGLLRCVRRRCLAGQILCQDFCHRHFSTDSHRHRQPPKTTQRSVGCSLPSAPSLTPPHLPSSIVFSYSRPRSFRKGGRIVVIVRIIADRRPDCRIGL